MLIQRLGYTLLLSSALVLAQSTPTTGQTQRDPARTEPGAAGQKDTIPPTQATPAPARKEIPPDAPVITIKGVCPPATAPAGCQTVVTRAQFETLVNALNPEMPPETRARFAENYGRLIVVASEARKAGVDKLPGTDQLYEFSNMQVLAQQFGRKLQEDAAKVPEGEIETYYREHQKDYDMVQLERLIVPRHRTDAKNPAAATAPTEAQEKAYADKIRQRWVAGEDPTKLQQETYKHESLDAPPPAVAVGERRRNGLPMNQQAVFDLKAGDVSEPFSDPAAFFIYKVTKRESKTLADVREEIKKTLTGERLQKSMEKVTKAAEASLNQTYFEPAPPTVNSDREKKASPNPARPAALPTTKPTAKPAQVPKTAPVTPSK